MELPKEQCAEWKKGHLRCCCSLVWVTNGGRILWNVTAIFETFKISWLMGRHCMKGGSECAVTDQWYRFGAMIDYHLISAKDQSRLRQFGSKVMDASEIHARRLNAKEVLTPQSSGDFIFPIADGTVKIFGGCSASENIHLDLGASGMRRRTRNSVSQTSYSLQPFSRRLNEGNSFNVITLYSRIKLCVPKEESIPIPLKYIDVTRTKNASLDVLLEKQIEDYWIEDGEKLSDAWTGFTRFILLNEPPDGYAWSRWRLTRKQTTSRPDIEKPKLDNARQLRGNDEEFKLTMKTARRKLKVPMPAAIPIRGVAETHRNIGKCKTKYACVVDADESTRPRQKGAGHKPYQDHIIAKGMNSITQYSLVHKLIPKPQALKIPDAKSAVEKEWKNWWESWHGS